jgi:site-specific recombinase XerC
VPAVERSGNSRDLAVVLLLTRAQLRVGEIAGLRLADVNLGPPADAVTVRAPRGAARRVVLDAPTRRALAAYLAVRPASTSPALFLSQLGGGLSASGIHGLVAGHARRAGLTGVTPSALRRFVD